MNNSVLLVLAGGLVSIVTTLLTLLVTMWNDRLKWRREHSVRWNAQRGEAYAAILSEPLRSDEHRAGYERAKIVIPLIATAPVREAADEIARVREAYRNNEITGADYTPAIANACRAFEAAVRREREIE